jgi:uncharacterized protein
MIKGFNKKMKFINREKEIKLLKNHFKSEPNSLLFLYGPKSSGKSSLLSEVAQKLDAEKYAVNYLSLRSVLIYNFKTFLDVFFPKNLRNKAGDILSGVTLNFGFFSVKKEEESRLSENPFGVMVDKLISAGKRGIKPVIIIDEIQLLKNIGLNGERYLIDELFNLFIEITKTKHLAHAVLATSDSYFIEEIYNSSKLAKTSRFLLLDHFNQEEAACWLKNEKFSKEELKLVWEYLGGCPWEIRETITQKKQGNPPENFCLTLIKNSEGRLFEFKRKLPQKEKDIFDNVVSDILKNGFYIMSAEENIILDNLLKKCIESDIWFYNVEERKVTANSKSVWHALKRI